MPAWVGPDEDDEDDGTAELCENHTPVNFFVPYISDGTQTRCKNHQIPELTRNRDLCTSPRTCLNFNDNLYYYFKI